MQNQSEIARLKQRLDEECAAAWQGMHGFAETARHEAITKRMESIGSLHDELRECVGEKEATEALVRAMNRPAVQ